MPLYGDMSVHLIRWVKLSPNFDATRWSVTTEPEDKVVLASMPNIVARLGVFADEYNALIADLNVLRAKVSNRSLIVILDEISAIPQIFRDFRCRWCVWTAVRRARR